MCYTPESQIHALTHLHTHQVHDIDELKHRLTKIWRGLGQRVIDDAMTYE